MQQFFRRSGPTDLHRTIRPIQTGSGSNDRYGKMMQLQRQLGNRAVVQWMQSLDADARQPADNRRSSGLPAQLKAGLERMSGFDLSDVRVHYHSDEPAAMNAHAYAQGNDIHLGPGQEKHLPHEGWHVVQQRQGRVKPTAQMKGEAVNDSAELEQEADEMGEQALGQAPSAFAAAPADSGASGADAAAGKPGNPPLQLVKMLLAQPPNHPESRRVAALRNLIAAIREQLVEYDGYPPIITMVDGTDVAAAIQTAEDRLNQFVNDLGLTEDSELQTQNINQHYNDQKPFKAFNQALGQAFRGVNNRFNAWTEWRTYNPDSVDELEQVRGGTELGLDDEAEVQYGTYNGLVYKSFGGTLPEQANGEETSRYFRAQEKEEHIAELRDRVAELDTSQPVVIPHGSPLRSNSMGAERLRPILEGGGALVCTRVMHPSEAQKTRETGGHLIPKLGAAKWITIGTTANIHSSGDESHSETVQWTISADFRNVLLMEGMHYYNENEDSASSYAEPYWVWKDAEEANIALSPVVTAIFNDKIQAVTINGEPL